LSALDDLLSLSYPYRTGKLQYFGTTPQQPGSIPLIHERPDVKKTKGAQAYQQAKIKASGTLGQRQLSSLTGLVPKPDNSQVIAAERILKAQATQRTAAKAKRPKKAPKAAISGLWGTGKAKQPPVSVAGLQQVLRALQQGKPVPANAGAATGKGISGLWGGGGPAASGGISSLWAGG
jgi:hypothetical protein